jgi:hypothetical protein
MNPKSLLILLNLSTILFAMKFNTAIKQYDRSKYGSSFNEEERTIDSLGFVHEVLKLMGAKVSNRSLDMWAKGAPNGWVPVNPTKV